MTFEGLKARIPDPDALEERAAIIEFESGEPKPSRWQAECAAVRQWLEAEREKKPKTQAKMFG
ncbi:hypothetical protein [Planctomyces sp. SH-PL14]|uniref:hypothetical protein n=1 Tax=Planctomyces sp. SH-PL14 TaxID=1632864 RepID=UPI00078BF7A2|nr:hypothetical protein [Planctomyces sp. SH-PL14]AMV20454.1 hypothetical protein VT03_21325 [Planctomyces sp. SH-PL14]